MASDSVASAVSARGMVDGRTPAERHDDAGDTKLCTCAAVAIRSDSNKNLRHVMMFNRMSDLFSISIGELIVENREQSKAEQPSCCVVVEEVG